jgi:hypothetical protein
MGNKTFVERSSQNEQPLKVGKIVEKHYDSSLKNAGAKGRRKFEGLSKLEKRQWREALQRAIAACKNRIVARVLSGVKPRGKTKDKYGRWSKLECQLMDALDDSHRFADEVELQSGKTSKYALAAAAFGAGVAGAVAGAYAVRRIMSNVDKATNEVTSMTTKATDMIGSIIERFQEFVQSIKTVGGWLFKFSVAIAAYWLCSRFLGAPALISAIVAVALPIVPEARDFLTKATNVATQDGFGEAASILALASMFLVPSRAPPRFLDVFLRNVAHFPKVADGLEMFLDKSIKLVESFVNYVLKRDSSSWISLGRKKTLIDQWRLECIDLCRVFDSTAKPERSVILQTQKKVQEGYGFMQTMTTREAKNEVGVWLDKLNTRLTPHLGTLSAEHNVRATPYMVMLGGGSGVGKTSVVQAFASFVLLLSGEVRASEVLQNLWQKGISEYWNGYMGQRAIIKDDCFQVKGAAACGAHDSEAMEIIRAVGNWACPLNFADVDSKGRYYLDVSLIVGTTNAANIKSEWEVYITNPEALVRRFQGAYWLEVNPEYRTHEGRYDFDKIGRLYRANFDAFLERERNDPNWKPDWDDILDLFPWQAWTVRHHGFDHSNPMAGPIMPGGLKEAVKIAARTIRDRREKHVQSVNLLQDHLDAMQRVLDRAEFQAGETSVQPAAEEEIAIDMAELPRVQECGVNTEASGMHFFPRSPSECAQGEVLSSDVHFFPPITLETEGEDETWISILKERISKWCASVYESLGLPIPIVGVRVFDALALGAAAAVIIGGVKILWGVVSTILKSFGVSTSVASQSNSPPAKESAAPKKFDFPRVTLQLGTPPQDGIHDAIYRNMYAIEVYNKGEAERIVHLGSVLGIGDSVYIMPAHFYKKVAAYKGDTKKVVRLTLCHHAHHVVDIPVSVFLNFPTCHAEGFDVMGFSMGRYTGTRANRNIVNYFLERNEISNVLRGSNVPVRLDVVRPNRYNGFDRNVMYSPHLTYSGTVVADGEYGIRGCVKYEMPTLAGDCGGPLTLNENRFYGGRAILGIHIAGRSGFFTREGYSVMVPQDLAREMWLSLTDVKDSGSEEFVEQLSVPRTEAERVEIQQGLTEAGLVGGSIVFLGEIREPLNVACKSALKPTPMNDDALFGPTPTRPAVLVPVEKDGRVIYPLARAVEAYQSPVLVNDPDALRPIVDMAMRKHWEATARFPRDVLTFEEAVVPPEGWKLKPLNRKSSAGYKYRKVIPNLARYPGKTYFLGFEGDVDFESQPMKDLREDVEWIIDSARMCERTFHLFTDFLKDELRPLAKVEEVRTRMISGAELDYTIAVRMYFGAFQAAMLATPVVNGMSPGINHYTQWYMLAEGLLSKGGAVFDGDFSRFDASEQPWVHMAILDYINRWYAHNSEKPDIEQGYDDMVRTVLWEDLIHSRHLTGMGSQLKYVVQWNKSLPSGHPLTTTVNSMYSLIALTACYVKLTGDANDMWKHVFINTFGDDNITGVDGEKRELFNQVTVAPVMRELFGLEYTAGVKDGVLVKYTDIFSVVYLQRTFAVDDDVDGLILNNPNVGWVAPLNFKSFLYTPYWYRNMRDPVKDLADNCEILVCELALHPLSVWEEYFPKLQRWCGERKIPLRFINRDAARAHVKTRLDVWF